MSKLVGIFCLFLLVAGVRLENEISENNPEELNSSAATVISSIDKALTQLENGIEDFKRNTWKNIDYLRSQGNELVNKVRNFVDFSTSKVEDQLSRFLSKNISDITCDLVGQFQEQALHIFDNVNSCVNGTIDGGIERIRNISNAGSKVRMELQKCRKMTIDCTRQVTNITDALLCVAKAAAVSKVVLKTVPQVIMDLVNVTVVVSTLPQKLEYCVSWGPIRAIQEHYISVIAKFPSCLTDKVSSGISYIWERIMTMLQDVYRSYKENFTENEPFDVDEIVDIFLPRKSSTQDQEFSNIISGQIVESNNPAKLDETLKGEIADILSE